MDLRYLWAVSSGLLLLLWFGWLLRYCGVLAGRGEPQARQAGSALADDEFAIALADARTGPFDGTGLIVPGGVHDEEAVAKLPWPSSDPAPAEPSTGEGADTPAESPAARVAALELELAAGKRALVAARRDGEAASRGLDVMRSEAATASRIIAELTARVRELEGLDPRPAARDAAGTARTPGRTALAEREEQIDILSAQLEAVVAESSALRERLGSSEARVATLEDLERRASAALGDERRRLALRERSIRMLEGRVVAQAVRAGELERRLARREADIDKWKAMATSLVRMRRRLREREAELGPLREAAARLDDTERRLRAREREIEGVKGIVARLVAAEERPPAHEREPGRRSPDAPRTRPERLFEPCDERDDLKLIKGIGPKLERLLNELGVTAFAQLAAFTPQDIERVTAAIRTFPGRIERDDWVGQARARQHRARRADA